MRNNENIFAGLTSTERDSSEKGKEINSATETAMQLHGHSMESKQKRRSVGETGW